LWPTLPTARVSHDVYMELAAAIILVLLVLVPAVVVLAMFVWAARKDGQADRAVQARLGIRRSTRLGR
jgi:NADH:ubiquinone oxidoreductase subunit H